jgi:methionyl-tRNA synthetase
LERRRPRRDHERPRRHPTRSCALAFLEGEVHDLSVSRNAAGWGLPVPGDPSQVIYVWCDALASCITQDLEYWRDAERIHVIGKGITRFHAVYCLAFLLAADLPVHGYLTINGKKISKSAGGADVELFIATCGVDAVRWYFARRCRTRADSDVTVRAICDTYDRELADLVQRCTAAKLTGGRVPPREVSPLQALAEALPARVDAAFANFSSTMRSAI